MEKLKRRLRIVGDHRIAGIDGIICIDVPGKVQRRAVVHGDLGHACHKSVRALARAIRTVLRAGGIGVEIRAVIMPCVHIAAKIQHALFDDDFPEGNIIRQILHGIGISVIIRVLRRGLRYTAGITVSVIIRAVVVSTTVRRNAEDVPRVKITAVCAEVGYRQTSRSRFFEPRPAGHPHPGVSVIRVHFTSRGVSIYIWNYTGTGGRQDGCGTEGGGGKKDFF